MTEPTPHNCPLCDAPPQRQTLLADYARDTSGIRTMICTDCGFAFTSPRPTAAALEAFYAQDYRRAYKGIVKPKKKHVYANVCLALDRLAALSDRLAPGARILDIGSGAGEFVYAARKAGFAAEGIELNRDYAEFSAREYDLPIRNIPYTAFESATPFDAIVSFHVFEHLLDPLDGFRFAHRLLKDGGLLEIEVPNLNSRTMRSATKFHFAHVNHFTVSSLAFAAAKCGFGLVNSNGPAARDTRMVFVKQPTEAALPDGSAEAQASQAIIRRYRHIHPGILRYGVRKLAASLIGLRLRSTDYRAILDEAITSYRPRPSAAE